MSKLYDDVKKQGEQIDDLQKTVTNHGTRIETLETKAKATPPPQAVNQGPITVKLPDNIATNESIGKLLDEKLTATSTDGTLKKVMEQLPGSLSKGVADVLSDNLGDKVKDALYEGFRREFADERRKLYDVVNDMRYKAQSIIWGAMVACNPTLGLCHLCCSTYRRRRFRLWILLSAQRKLKAKRCRMALPIRKALVGRQAAGRFTATRKNLCCRHTT